MKGTAFVSLGALLLTVFLVVPNLPGVETWRGWTAVSALGTAAAGFALVMLAWQILIQQRGHSLEQVRLALDFGERFAESDRRYHEAWAHLRQYDDRPENMTGTAWHEVVDALAKVYRSLHFLRQVERLREREIISTELLALLYFDSIVSGVDAKFRTLLPWLGTGLDLAADFTARDLEIMLPDVRSLVDAVSTENEKHGGTRYKHIFEGLSTLEPDLGKARAAHEALELGHLVKVNWEE